LSDDVEAKERECGQCISQGFDKARGCDEDNQAVLFAWDASLRRCPWAVVTDSSWDIITAWREWRALGVLPWAGGIGDQPAWFVEALTICDTVSRSTTEQVGSARDDELKRLMDALQKDRQK